MATRLLCCVALCLLGVESKDPGVIQTPRHAVTKMGQAVTLSCEPMSGHAALYWYRQTSVRGLEFLISFSYEAPVDQSGMPKARFSATMPNASFCTLKIQPTEPGDSATYLCASSKDTALQSHMGAMVIQKPRYLVTRVGKPVTLSCSQNLNHDVMYWYQQKLSQAPKLLLYYYDKELNNEKDTSDNFHSSRPTTSFCSLDIRSAGLGDSAVYLCASSRDTELKPYLPSVHKPLFPRSKSLL
ncbi:uncharacterized protein LOC130851809 [Hippopotamus amphibius kiboko]|uniref:uncharacterized protein LOC130851809 n=1 Tax=Hippopotamus amphibius kiboko TaxID=575201 RepID=UPI0025933142|nr:uncharacterized protein LOC130851809 [Hippopotamus amphibius kiboko]